jgi:hypothetical protein
MWEEAIDLIDYPSPSPSSLTFLPKHAIPFGLRITYSHHPFYSPEKLIPTYTKRYHQSYSPIHYPSCIYLQQTSKAKEDSNGAADGSSDEASGTG